MKFLKVTGGYRSASYLSTQYLKAMYKMENSGTWTVPGDHLRNKRQPKVTSRNLKEPQATSRNLKEPQAT